MSAVGTSPTTVTPGTAPGRPVVRFGRVLHSEAIKALSQRSLVVGLALVPLLLLALGSFMAVGLVVAELPEAPTGPDPLGGSLSGMGLVELVALSVGVLVVTSEFASGVVRQTMTAVPRRTPVVVAKSVVVAAAVLVSSLVAAVVTFLVAVAILAVEGIELSLTDPGVLPALGGAAAWLAGLSLVGAAAGWLVRSTAGALAVVVGALYVPTIVAFVLPAEIGARVQPYLPGSIGGILIDATSAGSLRQLAALAALAVYVAIATGLAMWVVRRRDV